MNAVRETTKLKLSNIVRLFCPIVKLVSFSKFVLLHNHFDPYWNSMNGVNESTLGLLTSSFSWKIFINKEL